MEKEELKKHLEKVKEVDAVKEENETISAKVESEKKPKDEKHKLKNELNILKDKYLRVLAEFENYKKRQVEVRKQDREYANQELLEKLVNITDVFEKAINFETDNKEIKNFLTGFKMLNQMFSDLLLAEGVTKIKALNTKFDPNLHSCIQTRFDETQEENIVLEEIQTGFKIKDRVLRPSIVIVNQKNIKEEIKEEKEGKENE